MNCRGKILSEDFVNLIQESLGMDDSERLFKSLEAGEDIVSVRINSHKCFEGDDSSLPLFAKKIFGDNLDAAVEWCKSGYYLKQRISFTADPYFHCGAYYVQDASSMFPSIISKFFGDLKGARVLDLCAAPGGKSTHLASLLEESSLLVSNEVIRKRVLPLMDNIAKWGCANVVVTNNFPDVLGGLHNFFDLIFADVPCSGEGMFRKSGEAMDGWSLGAVRECAAKQKQIVSDVWTALKEGGIFVYSTCTYNHYEDEDNVDFICRNLGAEVLESAKFIPGVIRGEGQFYAVLKKNSAGAGWVAGTPNLKSNSVPKTVRQDCCNWLGNKYIYVRRDDGMVKAYPKTLAGDIIFLEKYLNVAASGIAVAIAKGSDVIPYADLALCNDFGNLNFLQNEENRGRLFPSYELTKEEALQFLTKRPLVLSQMPRGYIFLTYSGLGLGFVKNLGNRTNNLLPAGRAIHSTKLVDS